MHIVKIITFLHPITMNNIDHTSHDILMIFNVPTVISQKHHTSVSLKIYS